MSVQGAVDLKHAVKVELIPSDIYYARQPAKAPSADRPAPSALDQMYAYFGSDRA